jgi:CheY-like chemotaxis protein
MVLIIDDDRLIRMMLRDILEDASFSVAEAADGAEGVARAAELRPDLILLDAVMPGIDGYETCQQLKTGLVTRDIPVIFVTGSPDGPLSQRAYALGAVACIPKPFNPNALLATTQAALAPRQRRNGDG